MEKPITQIKKDRLLQYIYIKGEYEDYQDELARLENNQYIPAAKESDGSKKNPGASDRMANAVLRRMAYEESIAADMQRLEDEMASIERSVACLRDGLERRVLRMRYIIGSPEGRQHMAWRDIAIRIYGDDDDAQMQAVYRIHGRALQNIDLEVIADTTGK